MSGGPFEKYVRHGRRFGVDDEFWTAAADDLGRSALRRLAAELDVKLSSKWATARNHPCGPALQAGLTVDKSRPGLTGRPIESVDSEAARRHSCGSCNKPLGMMNTSGLCRLCYQRDHVRRRRAER